jgi:hypothetical protein
MQGCSAYIYVASLEFSADTVIVEAGLHFYHVGMVVRMQGCKDARMQGCSVRVNVASLEI